MLGAVSVPMNNRLSAPEVRAILEHAEVTAVVVGERLPRSRCAPLLDTLDSLTVAVSVGAPTGGGIRRLRRGEERGCRPPSRSPVDDDDLADVMYTSGTTGQTEGGRRPPRPGGDGAQRPTRVAGNGLVHRIPGVHLRRPRLHLQPDEGRHDRAVPSPVRCRAVARDRRTRTTGDRLHRPGHGPAPHPPPAVRIERPVQPQPTHPGQRPPGAGHAAAPAGQGARCRRPQQLRHDRGRATPPSPWIRKGPGPIRGRWAGRGRPWRSGSSTTREYAAPVGRGRRSHHPEPRRPPRVLQGSRGHRPHVGRGLAAHRATSAISTPRATSPSSAGRRR